eukprot:76777-Pyramimonas_sp.AAC.2
MPSRSLTSHLQPAGLAPPLKSNHVDLVSHMVRLGVQPKEIHAALLVLRACNSTFVEVRQMVPIRKVSDQHCSVSYD